MKAFITALFLICLPAIQCNADDLRLADNAPTKYVVVPGDTLWGISARFLKDPWKWPQIWGMNRAEIKNPHWIYPGNVIVLETVNGQPHLTIQQSDAGDLATVKLSPSVRGRPMVSGGILPIPADAIEAFANQSLVLDKPAFDHAPMIIDYQDEHIVVGAGDMLYATSDGSNTSHWQIVRPGDPIIDPAHPKEVLGYSAEYLGEADTVTPGNPQRIRIVSTQREVQEKDRLLPVSVHYQFNFVPHAPDKPIAGRIIATPGIMREAGQYNVILINRGTRDGLEPGDVLAVYRKAQVAGEDLELADEKAGLPKLTLPPTRIALCMVYRSFDKVAYALIMNSTAPVNALDTVRNP